MSCKHQMIHDCDIGYMTGCKYCLKCKKRSYKDEWIKKFVFWAMDIHGNTVSWCQRYGKNEEM